MTTQCAALLLALTLVVVPGSLVAQDTSTGAVTASAQTSVEAVLKPADLAGKVPDQVFFRGQSATVQMRNSGGIRFADGMLVLAALVDTSGYSSGIQQKYQGYLIAEVPLQIEGHRLPPGEYGFGFVAGDVFLVMDIGAHDQLTAKSTRDTQLRHATPLQLIAAPDVKGYRLYSGRTYVTLTRAE